MTSSTPNQEQQQPTNDPRLEAYLSQNKQWANNLDYNPPIPFLEMQKQGRNREDGTVIVIACTDPRVTPEEFMGMSRDRGNKATIIRTAGGRVQYAIETLYVLAAVGNKGMKGLIIVVHHTDCGLCYASDEEIGMVVRRRGMSVEDGARFGCFVDPEVSVKEDVEFLRAMSLFSGTTIVGLVQDTQTGVVRQVI